MTYNAQQFVDDAGLNAIQSYAGCGHVT